MYIFSQYFTKCGNNACLISSFGLFAVLVLFFVCFVWRYRYISYNTDLTVAEKRTIIVLLHKLGIPIIVPTNEAFDIHRIHFADRIIDEREIDGIVLQINQRHCDNLFFIDAESYFGANRQYITVREVGKRYVREVLAKSEKTDQILHEIDLGLCVYVGRNSVSSIGQNQ